LSFNKSTIAKLQTNKIENIKGGNNTLVVACGNTEYPACGISGCWGAQSCFPDTGEGFCQQ